MALERGKLSNVVRVAAGSTVGIITCASNKKVYVKSIICHASGIGIETGAAAVYFVPNGGSVTAENRIFNVDVRSGETVLIEPSYPLVLDATGDSIRLGAGGIAGVAATHVNFIITGDKES